MILEILFILFFCIGDFYTTKVGIESGKCKELNNIVVIVIKEHKYLGLAIFKIITTIFVLFGLFIVSYIFPPEFSYISEMILKLLIVASIFVVMWNIIIIYKNR